MPWMKNIYHALGSLWHLWILAVLIRLLNMKVVIILCRLVFVKGLYQMTSLLSFVLVKLGGLFRSMI